MFDMQHSTVFIVATSIFKGRKSKMAVSSSRPAEHDAKAPNQEKAEIPRSGNNDDHLADSSYARQNNPESAARTSKSANRDAFVLDGEWFYDAVAVEGEDANNQNAGFEYWGLQVDKETRTVYYFNYSQPEEMQWLPPANLIHPETHEVLLWEASAQWFYYYNPQTKESRWLDEKVRMRQDDGP